MQQSFFNVLESLYQFPEVVMKVACEYLETLDALIAAADRTRQVANLSKSANLVLLGATVPFVVESKLASSTLGSQPPLPSPGLGDEDALSLLPLVPYAVIYADALAGHTTASVCGILSQCHTFLARFWPLAASERDVSISEKDLRSLLKGLYPSESMIRVNFDELLADIQVSCQGVLSFANVTAAFTTLITTSREPILAKMHELITYKCSLVQWTELDAVHLWEAIRLSCPEEVMHSVMREHAVACMYQSKVNRLPPQDMAVIAADLLWTALNRFRPK